MSVSTTYEQVLAQVRPQLSQLSEDLQPTTSPTLTQVWSLQQAIANVLAGIPCHLSDAGLAFIIERDDAWKIRMDNNNATLPRFPIKPVAPTTGAIEYKNFEREDKAYTLCIHFDTLCIQIYRAYFIGKF